MSVFPYLISRHNPPKMPGWGSLIACQHQMAGPVLSGKRSLNRAMSERPALAATNNQQPTTNNQECGILSPSRPQVYSEDVL